MPILQLHLQIEKAVPSWPFEEKQGVLLQGGSGKAVASSITWLRCPKSNGPNTPASFSEAVDPLFAQLHPRFL